MNATDIIARADELSRRTEAGGLLHGLPRDAYISEDFFRREQETLFRQGWVLVGFAHEIARPGDVRPVSVGGMPVLLVREGGGGVRGFHNVCRHRGATLVDKPCSGQRLMVCPYHHWSYDLTGRLRATPHFGGFGQQKVEGFEKGEWGLKPVRVGVWHDWIFVNLDGEAPDFEEHCAPLAQLIDDFDMTTLMPLAVIDLGVVKANWKLLMENFIEPYHVPFVHPETTEGQPLDGHYPVINGGCLGAAVDVADGSEGPAADRLNVSSRYLTLFPTFVLGVYMPDQMGVHLNEPVGPGETRQRRAIYAIGEGARFDTAQIEALRELWRAVHKEDHAIVERMQQGRASPVMDDGGVLSPHWETSERRFQQMVVEAVR